MVKQMPDNIPLASVTLTTEDTFLTRYDAKGKPVQTYPVKASDVAAAFNVFGASTGLLPPDTLFWQSSAGRSRLAIWLPPQVRKLTFDKGRRGQVMILPMPGFVFIGEGGDYSIYAATMRPMHESMLYVAPLPNVNMHGLICAGNVEFPECAPETILNAANLFFSSRFNGHLSEDKVKGRETLEKKLWSLHGNKNAFPDKWLVQHATMKRVMEGTRNEYR